MKKRVRAKDLAELSTDQLWVLAFKTRHEAMVEVDEMKPRPQIIGSLSLLGWIMGELRSRGMQGKLDL